jgi:hypothetical protein
MGHRSWQSELSAHTYESPAATAIGLDGAFNLEAPALFNQLVERFLVQVERSTPLSVRVAMVPTRLAARSLHVMQIGDNWRHLKKLCSVEGKDVIVCSKR